MLNLDSYPEVLNVEEIAEILRLSKDSAYRMAKNTAFPATRIGKRILIDKSTFSEWWEEMKGKEFIL